MKETVLEKTIWNVRDERYERVSLTQEELEGVERFVLKHNLRVVTKCLGKVDEHYPEIEPARRIQLGTMLADKLCIRLFTAHSAALQTKISDIRDAVNSNGAGLQQATPST